MSEISFPSEKFIEDYVYDTISSGGACPITGDCADIVYRQHEIKGYGVTDIIKLSINCPYSLQISILELKNEPLKESHLSQLMRYMVGAKRQASRYLGAGGRWNIDIYGELAGPLKPEKNDLVFMLDHCENISVYDIGFSMDIGFSSRAIAGEWYKSDEDIKGGRLVARKVFDFHRRAFSGRLDQPRIICENGEKNA